MLKPIYTIIAHQSERSVFSTLTNQILFLDHQHFVHLSIATRVYLYTTVVFSESVF